MKVVALPSSKKGDLEFIEAIMVLVVVVILLVIGIVIYYNVSSAGISQAGERISEVKASVLVNVIDSLPEVQCSIRSTPKGCVDVVKLQALKKLVETSKVAYSDVFGFKVVRFEQIYPVPSIRGNGECSMAAFQSPDYPLNCGNWTVYSNPKPGYKSRDIVRTPVSLFNPITSRYAVGVLFLEVYR